MPRSPLTPEHLWNLPRVGGPSPSPDGTRVIVPVTTYSLDTNQSTTRLWLVPADAKSAGNGAKNDPGRPLTTADSSSSQVSWSPDGSQIAFVRKPGGDRGDAGDPPSGSGTSKPGPKHNEVPQLYVMSLDGGEPERWTDLPLGVGDPQWLPDGSAIVFVSQVYQDALTIPATAARAQENEEDPVKAHVTENRFYRYWDHYLTEGKIHHIFLIDGRTRAIMDVMPDSTRILDPESSTGIYRLAPDGREVAFSGVRTPEPYDELLWGAFTLKLPAKVVDNTSTDKPSKGPRVREVTPKSASGASTPTYSPDGRYLLIDFQVEQGFYADRHRLAVHDRKTRKQILVTEEWDFSIGSTSFGKDPNLAFLSAEVDARTGIFVLDLKRALEDPTGNPPREITRGGTLSGVRLAGDRIFANCSHIDQPPEVYSFDARGKGRRRLTGFTQPIMDGVAHSNVEEIYFTGAENDRVQMFVIYPPGVKKPAKGKGLSQPLPLVHMIHGGPHGTFGDTWHWRWSAMAFAARGYACALVNFHGSTSWGQEFCASILGRWGDQPYKDIMAATDLLVERGVADPKKMAVSGGSYGGYLVSWIASQTDRFRCIVNHAGVCDLQTQYASDVTHGRSRSMGGEPWDNVEGMDRYNPMRHARGFKSPMMVIHGELDYRVPYVQGLEIYNVYKAMGLPAKLVIYPDENHWILKPRNSIHWYGEVFDWFGRWLDGKRKKPTKR